MRRSLANRKSRRREAAGRRNYPEAVLASVLSYAAFKGNAYYGALLLFVYRLGAGIPLLAAASVSSRFAQRLDVHGYRLWVDRVTGALLLGLGFYLLWVA